MEVNCKLAEPKEFSTPALHGKRVYFSRGRRSCLISVLLVSRHSFAIISRVARRINQMSDRRIRVLTIASHPVQYSSPLFRLMAQHPRIDFQVAYCTLRGAEPGHDPEFGRSIQWDVPLLEGYKWTHFPNRGSGDESFFGLCNPGLWRFIREGHFDAILCHTGYPRASFWISYFAAKLSGSAFLFGTDAVTLTPRDGRSWKRFIKALFWPWLFRLADQVIIPSTRSRELILSLGISPERVTLTPYCVDNDWWSARAARVNRTTARTSLGIPPGSLAILFCAKLQPWKRPLDLLYAIARANRSELFVLFAGDGPLYKTLETEARQLGITHNVKFLGFINQQTLPEIYRAADLMVLPSEYEPFGVVVNEAILCSCPVLASDQVGAAHDLIRPVLPGFVFPSGDLDFLSSALLKLLGNPGVLEHARSALLASVQAWSPAQNISATVEAIESAIASRSHQRKLNAHCPVSQARNASLISRR